MSLQVWLPLNGNLNNQGTSDVTVTNNGATVNNSGKIGQCYSFNGSSQYINYSGFDTSDANELTVSFWACPTNATLDYAFVMQTSGNYYQFSLDNGILSVRDDSTGATGTRNRYSIGTITSGQWIHMTFTYNHGTVKIYRNGVLYSTNTTGGSHLNSGISVYNIGRTYSSQYYSGKINDFRVYDHALSPKEVKEMSQGLVLHYRLDELPSFSTGQEVTWNQMLQNGNFSNGTTNWSVMSYGQISSSSDGLVVTKTGTGGAGGRAYQTPASLDTTHKYYICGRIKTNTGTSATFGFLKSTGQVGTNDRCSTQSTTFVTLSKIVSPENNTDVFSINAGSSSAAANSNITCNYVYCIDLTQMFGAGNEPATAAEFEAIYPQKYYEYNTGTTDYLYTNPTIYDCSGYGYNATTIGILQSPQDSPRYKYSADFFNGESRAKTTTPTSEITTISVWVKTDKTRNQFVIGNYESGLCVSFYKSNIISYYSVSGSQSTGSKCSLGSSYNDNGWNHLVVVKTGTGTRDVYCNGVKLTPVTNDYWNTYENGFIIGSRYYSSMNLAYLGQISDIRAYTTALSEQDILDLYNTSAYIDNQANQYCYELDEQSENLFTSENLQKYRSNTNAGSGEWTTRNNIPSIALGAQSFRDGSSYAKVLKDEFKPNTQYLFDMWIDVDDLIYQGTQRTGGIGIRYSDGSRNDSALVFSSNGSSGFVHKRFITPSNISVSNIVIYYAVSTPFYCRYDSTITEYHDVDITRQGIVDCAQVKEYTNRTNNAYVKGGLIETKELKEI